MKIIYLSSTFLLAATAHAEKPEVQLSAHTNFAFGSSNIEESMTASHAHDPNDEFTVQGVELSGVIKFNEFMGLQGAYNFFLDEENHADGEWEDAFATFQLPSQNLRLKAGRLFNETTTENNVHLHAWSFANSSLLTTRFNGEEGLLTESVQLSWQLPTAQNVFVHLSHGDAIEHEHHHEDEHGHDEHDDEHEDEHDEHEDEHDEHEDEGEHEDEIHGEDSFLRSDITTFAVTGSHFYNDFHQIYYRGHYTWGTNGYGLDSSVYGAAVQYQWRENGQEAGGKYFITGLEYAHRKNDFASEDGDLTGSDSESGFSLTSQYGFGNNWEIGSRFDSIQGSDQIEETPQSQRISAALTRRFDINENLEGHVRFQLDHLDQDDQADATTAWLQLQFSFGSGY